MKCPQCQHENETAAKFCEECAAPLPRSCGNCGRQVSPTARFCPECARPTGLATATPTADRFASPESYTPRHLAEKILTSKAALEGERKQVTVLFADLKGSMELLADRDPEEARKLLDPVLERMMEAIHRYEGTVNQVMGDGIMALFGAPLAHEDHAVRACYAALRMQEAVQRYAEGVRRSEGFLVQIRVGLNSGEVVVRTIGSDLHMDYSAVGQTTHLAARLEQLAAPGTALMSAEALRLAEGYVQVKSVGPVNVKGLTQPLDVYELIGAGSARTRLQAAAARGLTRFVGRDAEMEQLRRAQGAAEQGHGQIVATVGEPGVGKSRLFHEFTHSHHVHGWLVLAGGSVSYGKATPYLPLIDLLKTYFHVEARDEVRRIREKVTGKLLALDRTLERTLPAFLSLLDVLPQDAEWHALDPRERRQRTREAIKRLLRRESQVQPLVLVCEDLHWIDSETQAFLDNFIESLPTVRALLLANYRPEYQHGWGSKTYYVQLRIDSLPPESAGEMLDGLLGHGPELQPLKRLLIERTEGNPLFLEEGVRDLFETGVLTGERGAYRPAKPLATMHVPATVQAVLAARIDRLAPDDKQVLQAAAVVGKDVPLVLLREIAETPQGDLQQVLPRLQAREFLYETSLFPEIEYTFKHALTHEVTYGGVLQSRRRELHARIVETIERLHGDRPAEHVDRLAHHAVRAEAWDKALTYLRQAAAKAADRLALRPAAAYLEQAIAAADRLPRRRDVLEQSIDLHTALRAVLFPLNEYESLHDHLSQAAALAGEIDDDLRLGRVVALQAHYHCVVVGDTRQALECVRRATAIADRAGAPSLVGTARFTLGQVLYAGAQYLEAIAALEANLELFQGELAHERGPLAGPIALLSRVWLAFALTEVGRFTEGIATGEKAVREAEALNHLYSLYHAHWALAAVRLGQGQHERAAEAAAEVRRIASEADLQQMLHNGSGLLGHAHALAGRVGDGLALLEGALIAHRNAHAGHRDILYLADVYLRSGRLDDALRTARRALDVARTSHEPGREAHALRVLGDIQAARGNDSEAEQLYRDVIARGTVLGMRPLVAHGHFGLGRLCRRTGQREPAREHLATAIAMYREMEMRLWLEQGEVEMTELA
jgi:class 3 adenylate cyclase/tetratricopeptide (TPR) repeat protein